MRQVVPLHLGHVLRQSSVVQRVVHAVVQDVERKRSADDTVGDGLGEQGMGESGERRFKDEEEQGRHDEAETVHRQVVMDAVQQEVKHDCPVGIRKVVIDVEEEAVEGVFEDGPDDVADEEAGHGLGERSVGRGRESLQIKVKQVLCGDATGTSARKQMEEMTNGALNCRMEREKRKVAIGPQNMGTTYHWVRVNAYGSVVAL